MCVICPILKKPEKHFEKWLPNVYIALDFRQTWCKDCDLKTCWTNRNLPRTQ